MIDFPIKQTVIDLITFCRWILQNYTNPNDKILDTHLGSQSSRIACYDMGFYFVGFELDKEYFELETSVLKNLKVN